ncbi:MAG TPA: hypothetical protein DCL72_11955 [Rhizobiales bacterium]|jgi:hypothetical protein|nr:hypothetical protein [Hyphomicrobiales bacterium]HAN62803.1 hypothetical protein [Hyphomicrobiales bacterium]
MRRLLIALVILGAAFYAAGALWGPDTHSKDTVAASASIKGAHGPPKAGHQVVTHIEPRAQGRTKSADIVWAYLSRAGRLRDGPSSHARVLQHLDVGAEVKIIWRRTNGWVQIKQPGNSQLGWTREKNLAWRDPKEKDR